MNDRLKSAIFEVQPGVVQHRYGNIDVLLPQSFFHICSGDSIVREGDDRAFFLAKVMDVDTGNGSQFMSQLVSEFISTCLYGVKAPAQSIVHGSGKPEAAGNIAFPFLETLMQHAFIARRPCWTSRPRVSQHRRGSASLLRIPGAVTADV